MWQTLETKARFIGQVMTGESDLRRIEDIDGTALTYMAFSSAAPYSTSISTSAPLPVTATAETPRGVQTPVTASAPTPTQSQTRDQVIEEFNTTITAQVEKYSTFQTNCIARLEILKRKLKDVNDLDRANVVKMFDSVSKDFSRVDDSQSTYLGNIQKSFPNSIASPQANPQQTLKAFELKVTAMENTRVEVKKNIDTLSMLINGLNRNPAAPLFTD